ncbi:MAG: tetratricopeptide repeat protein [Bacteroidetes bacterium]|nr:tetratricopeptide repeat protein [Bacteroidota bacterium]
MKRSAFFIFLAFCLYSGPLSAQLDSLSAAERGKLALLPFDTMRVDSLNEWAYHSPSDQAELYAQTALAIAQKIGYREGISDSYVQLGIVAADAGNYESATQFYRSALHERIALKRIAKAAGCYNQLGHLQRRQGHYEEAIVLYRQGLALMKNQAPHINTGYLYNSLGSACRLAGQYDNADTAFMAGLRLYTTLIASMLGEKNLNEYKEGLATLQLNSGAFLQENRFEYQQSKELLLKSLAEFRALGNPRKAGKCLLLLGNNAYYTGNYEEAETYYDQSLSLQSSIEKKDYYSLLKNRARVWLDQHKYDRARSDFQAALEGFSSLHDTAQMAATRFELGNFYYEQSSLDSAVWHYQQALNLQPEDLLLQGRVLYFLSDVLDQLGREQEAEVYTKTYLQLLNTLNDDQTRGAFEELNRYQKEKNRIQIRLLKQENDTTRLYAGVVASALIIIALFFFFRAQLNAQKRRTAEQKAEVARQREELASKEREIAVQEKFELLNNKTLDTHYARLEGQEHMQKQIGKELHDGLGTVLATVKINLAPVDEVLGQLTDQHRRQFMTANRLLDQACADVRRMAHDLESAVLMKFGLEAQLEALRQAIESPGKLQVELSLYKLQDRLPYHLEFNIYRIIQELVKNVITHAHASHITIQVNRLDNLINILVEDDGRGFDLEKVRQQPGVGMINLEARVHSLNGKTFIDTQPGRGTTVSIDIPVFPEPA